LALYPVAGETRFRFEDLHDAGTAIFRAAGMDEADASLLAHTLAWADLRGIHSHGVLRIPDYAAKLTSGGVDPKGRPKVVSDRGAALVVDGGNSMGQIGACFAMDKAIERARELGVAVAALGGSNHCGAMAYFALRAMEQGMIGIAATNALPTIAPWGGLDKIVGINPVGIAIPTGSEDPLVLDCAFSYSSHGKIRVYQQKGLPVPPTWAFDRQGRPTTDSTEALAGLLQPIGEYKGVGLGILFGVLSTVLSGASYGTDLGNMVDGARAGADGQFLMAINIGHFVDPATLRRQTDQVVRQIRESRRADGVEALYAPGGLEAAIEERYRGQGIPLSSATVEGLRAAAAAVKAEIHL